MVQFVAMQGLNNHYHHLIMGIASGEKYCCMDFHFPPLIKMVMYACVTKVKDFKYSLWLVGTNKQEAMLPPMLIRKGNVYCDLVEGHHGFVLLFQRWYEYPPQEWDVGSNQYKI